ncbi:MAG: 3-dehydroquinate synthase family protein [Candidatus Shikimatogenerans sp. AspAUS03]|uniref:3-dehydroquinate synthase family protein n=1 Tax=Candidatus Shikimatogenerans sp. AspAUS03 TaxID=3158563 RepID=A0AAU7QT96_9FLAO
MNIIYQYNLFFQKIKKYLNYNIIILTNITIYNLYIKYFLLNIKKYVYKYLYIIKIYDGEIYKNIYTCIKIFNKLLKKKINRNTIILNLGGGVITDLGGFIASIYKRGIIFFNIPTSLLSIIDASIGGKNGINYNYLKNEIGSFYLPNNILIDKNFLLSLKKKDILSGLSELIKYSLIINYKLFILIIINYKFNFSNLIWNKILKYFINIKLYLIKLDYRENNIRKFLNFGHTIGHALESYYLNNNFNISHGESVIIGILYELWLSIKLNILKKNIYINIKKFIFKIFKYLYIKYNIIKYLKKHIIYKMFYDKKNFNKNINFTLIVNKKCTYNNILNKNILYKLFYKNI